MGKTSKKQPTFSSNDEKFFENIRKIALETELEMGLNNDDATRFAEKIVERTKAAYYLGKK